MKRSTYALPLFSAAFFSSFLITPVYADFDKTIEDALKLGEGGAIKFDANYRWEQVDRDFGADNTANANTIRTRLGILSPKFHGFQAFAEYEGTHALQADYNDGRGNKPFYSTVADPAQNELNQLWISYTNFDTFVKGGRQRIKFDDDRFIGNVGWRQLETTFDAVLVTNTSIKNLIVNAGYIGNVQTFLSTTENINAPILNINYKLGDYGNLIGYGYWLDYTEAENNLPANPKSSQTQGLRLNGATPKFYDHYSLLYTAEWAIQQDYQHSPVAYETHRYNVMGGFSAYFLTFQGAMEQLNGNANGKFFTPLGTNHAFQGWADLFLLTPANGIRDVFATVSGKFCDDSLTVSGVYHDYTDDTGNQHYGDEWNFQAVKKFGKHYSILAKYAYYNADNSDGYLGTGALTNTDTQKIWLQGNISF